MIDYGLLQQSIDYYTLTGFKRIESPWLVSEEILNITKPDGVHIHKVIKNGKEKAFVGSGEQSFLYLIAKGFLPSGKYQTVTPCMRDDNFGRFHTKYFMKNELIHFDLDNFDSIDYDTHLQIMIDNAFIFFDTLISKQTKISNEKKLQVVKTEQGFDINYGDIELGSYGIRHCEFVSWVYGTGLALPRFSMAVR